MLHKSEGVIAILSGPGGPHEAPEDVRSFVCFTTESLLVDQSKRYDAQVMKYVERLGFRGIARKPEYVSSERIAEVLRVGIQPTASATSSFGSDLASAVQRQVIARIKDAQKMGASDVHLICDRREGLAKFLYRVNGRLTMPAMSRMTYEEGKAFTNALYNTMCDVGSSFFAENEAQDARFKSEATSSVGIYGARVATRNTATGFVMVLRLLLNADEDARLESLGYLPIQIDEMDRVMDNSFGLCIVSGPTGSGKSKTLQTVLTMVIRKCGGTKHVMTMEQPCEYEIRGANQFPVPQKKDDSGPDYAGTVRSSLRLDPDVILVGEVRDHESAVAAFEASQTGHLVFTTTHANGAFEIVRRLIDEPLCIPRPTVLDPSIVKCLIGQRLVRVLCPDCSVPLEQAQASMRTGLLQRLHRVLSPEALQGVRVATKGADCKRCGGEGVTRRQVVAEVVRLNARLVSILDKDGQMAARKMWIEDLAGISMTMHALLLVAKGRVDPADAENSVGLLDEEVDNGVIYPACVAGERILRVAD